MTTDTLNKKPVLYDPYPGAIDTPQTRRCVLVDDTLDERIVAEMDAVFAMDCMLGELDVDIRKVRQNPPKTPRVYYVQGFITRRDDLAWLSRNDIQRQVGIYKETADRLAARLPPLGVDPNPLHLDEDLGCKIWLHADGEAEATAEIEALAARDEKIAWIAEQERLKRRIGRQVIHPLMKTQVERFGDMPKDIVTMILSETCLSASAMWRCHLFRAGALRAVLDPDVDVADVASP
jgi:hypothetical protein